MKISFEVSREKLNNMVGAIDDLLDYYQLGPSEYPIDSDYYEELGDDGMELGQAAYELGSILKSNLREE